MIATAWSWVPVRPITQGTAPPQNCPRAPGPTCRLRPLPAARMDSRKMKMLESWRLNSRMASSRASSGVEPSIRLAAGREARGFNGQLRQCMKSIANNA